jgi:RHS repeat-associated protein
VYDTLNRLQRLTPPATFASGNFGFTYDALSRRTQMTRPNGLSSNYTYDNLSRLLSVLHQSGSTTLDGASYTVDNAGNRASKTDKLANVTSNYTYDPIYQLTQVTQSASTTESYSYDPVGNRLSSLGVSSYTSNTSNELTSTSNATYTYDYNGNTQTKVVGSNTTSYAWDFENRLTSATLPGTGGTVTFAYDPFGRRIKKVTSTTTSIFAYDGDNLIEETNSSGAVVARYAETQNIDEPVAMLRSGATSYFHADGLGSVTTLSNAAGSIANTYTYDSFGKLTASTGSLVNPFQYTARESDIETGLYYYRARYYDPTAGRFLGEDPIGLGGGPNFYNYALGDPTNFSDPTGLLSVCTRPVRFFQWMGALGFCHGFLKLSDGSTIGGYNRNGKLVPNIRDPDDQSDPNHLKETKCIELPESKCPISNDARAHEAYDNLKNQFDQYKEATGHYPNYATGSGVSTGVAQTILDNAGIRYRFPARCFGWMSGTAPPIPGPTGGGGGAPW